MAKVDAFMLALSVACICICLEVLIPNGNWLYLFGLIIGTACFVVSFAHICSIKE